MALVKESITFNFTHGIDTFVDPNQLPLGKFQYLQNSIFIQADGVGKLQKRNGYINLAALDSTSSFITTYSNDLVSISNTALKAYSQSTGQFQTIAPITPLQLSVTPLIRNAYSQPAFDMSIRNGQACIAYLENASFGSGSGLFPRQRFAVADINTGQLLIPPTTITSTIGTISQKSISRVFNIGSQFAVFSGIPNANVSSGSFGSLQYFTINQNNLTVSSAVIFTNSYSAQTVGSASFGTGFDGIVSSNSLYFAWYAGSASGKSGVMATSFSNNLTQGSVASITQSNAAVTGLSICADNVGPSPSRLWYSCIGQPSGGVLINALMVAYSDYNFGTISSTGNSNFLLGNFNSVVSYAVNGTMTFLLGATTGFVNLTVAMREDLLYKGFVNLNFSNGFNITNIPGSNLAPASKPVVIGSDSYFLASFNSTYQSTYFLMNSASQVISKLSYGNGGGTYATDVPTLQTIGSSLFVGYLNKETITGVNKLTNIGSFTQTAGIYAQTGINLSKFNFTTSAINTIETANNLHINGGQVYHYDSQVLDELNFNFYPDFIDVNTGNQTLVGSMSPQTYYYVAVYEYTDNKGNIFRSAPSIPQIATIASGTANAIIVTSPTYLLTSKPFSAIRTTFYRWSQNQQVYYQATSQTSPLTNTDPFAIALGTASFVDRQSDAAILGNNILYTNGGVVEDDAPPAATALTMFDDRMWLIDSEDPNLLWYSKTILEGTPVEFSQLLTYFVPPTTATGAPTGPVTAFAPMDDKLILFKNQTIYYVNGTGPDNTGANSQYSPSPIFVISGVGCTNQNSIVLTPMGLMFQSTSKGLWLLKRDLSVDYIGKDVALYSSANVVSACLIQNTNQVRFTLNNGITLMYDYLEDAWVVNTNNGQSACIYQGLHTYLTTNGSIYQENPGSYLDGTVPVVMQFQTGFINPTSAIQGFQRMYYAYPLGTFLSGNTYTMGIAYDYNPAIVQTATINPTNTLGSGSMIEQWQIGFKQGQCQSFQLTFNEISSGLAGAGLSLSGVTLEYGKKKSYPRNIKPGNRTG